MRILLLLLPISALLVWAQPLPNDAASLKAGKTQYEFHCAFCHGRGDDGFAANLVSPRLPHAPSDASLVNIIRNGIPGTDMPPALGMTDPEIRQVAAYVRTLGRAAPQKVPGDAKRGQAIYNGKGGCNVCHMIQGSGGRYGPDLTAIGAMRSPANLRAAITDPDAAISPAWVLMEAEFRGGSKVAGIRLNEDLFSLQLRDASGKIHSLPKDNLVSVRKDLSKSVMPSYKTQLSSAELDDLIAYLFSLKGGN
jgi:putative heme-binding domain-containing protein